MSFRHQQSVGHRGPPKDSPQCELRLGGEQVDARSVSRVRMCLLNPSRFWCLWGSLWVEYRVWCVQCELDSENLWIVCEYMYFFLFYIFLFFFCHRPLDRSWIVLAVSNICGSGFCGSAKDSVREVESSWIWCSICVDFLPYSIIFTIIFIQKVGDHLSVFQDSSLELLCMYFLIDFPCFIEKSELSRRWNGKSGKYFVAI